jgi:hypothetical protein
MKSESGNVEMWEREKGSRSHVHTFMRSYVPFVERLSSPWASWILVTLTCLVVWGIVRWVFFVGFEGSDDLFYVRFASLWHRVPANQWEVRLLGNAFIRVCVKLFGYRE